MADDDAASAERNSNPQKVNPAFDAIAQALTDGHARTVFQNVGKPVPPKEKSNAR
jgi:hypothetical protein